MANPSPVLAGPPGDCCVQSVEHTGTAVGHTIKIADVDTYISEPPQGITGSKKVILYFSDVYGPFYLNSKLLQDYFANHGYIVLGIDYFLGDPIHLHLNNPNFNREAWFEKSATQATDVLPKWLKAVRETYGMDTQYSAVGYCFGARFATKLAATDDIVAAAFAHPARLTEDDFKKLKKPLLLLCAETDFTFSTESRRRAEDILIETKAIYHIQLFSGVQHGFATKGDPTIENTRWAKEQAARSVLEWFKRFNK